MKFSPTHNLIDPAAMSQIDASAIDSGIPIYALMERAGQAVAACALKHYPQAQRFVALCGIGNNGGDGFVAARALKASGADVVLHVLRDVGKLNDAARQAFDALDM